jgi:hypothetical protein
MLVKYGKECEVRMACSTNEEKRNSYRSLARKPEGKGPLWRHRFRREDKIKNGP